MNDARFEQLFQLTSIISLVFQIAGTALIAVLSYVVSRAVQRALMLYWAAGWACYTVALLAVMFAFRAGWLGTAILFGYYFLEYAAVLMIFAGCSYTATDRAPKRRLWFVLVPAAVVAVLLVAPPSSFFWPFAIHTAILGLGWASCLVALWPALRRPDAGPGVRIVAVGLVLLALDYMHHLPVAIYLTAKHLALSPYYYTIMSLVDGMLEFVLGFGTVIVIVDKVRADLEKAHFRLQLTHERTQEALHVDPLTQASTRYSFAATFGHHADRRAKKGCVVVVDLDGLKHINDTLGHGAGDAAIRAVAHGLRSLVRTDDRVYRWGGDEFVVVMVDMPLDLARRRMATLERAANAAPELAALGVPIAVSWGAAEFCDGSSVQKAIEAADAAMYEFKTARKGLAK